MGTDEQPPDQPDGPLRRPDLWLPPQQPQPPQPPQQPQQPPRPGPEPSAHPEPEDDAAARDRRPDGRSRSRKSAAGWVLVIAIVLIVVVAQLRPDDTSDPLPLPRTTRSPLPDLPEQATRISWQVDAVDLRSELGEAEFIGSISGDFDESYLAPIDGVWLALTGEPTVARAMLHGLDPQTGDELWRRDFDGGFCATEAGAADGNGSGREKSALCASALERDEETGLGTRWRLHRIDPRTGTDQATNDIDAWVTGVHLAGDTLVVLEQRRPAPHAVVSGYDVTTLSQRWTVDLSEHDGHQDMFSPNRIVDRPEPKDLDDLALDRPRFGDVGRGTVAVWAGQRTAFIEARSGELVMMPQCTRPTDDGDRLWCNTPSSAVAYSYRGRRLHEAEGVRLAHHDQDGEGRDVQRPIFIDPEGELHSVDLTSGEVHGAYAGLGTSQTWAGTLDPSAVTVGDHTFVSGDDVVALLDPDRDKLVWTNARITRTDLPILRDDQVWFTDSELTAVSMRDGVAEWETEILPGIYRMSIDDRIVGLGMETVAVLEVP